MYLDQKARNMANQALALIATHERVCTERAAAAADWRKNAGEKLEDISTSVSGLYSRLWTATGGLVLVLLAVIGYLVAHKGL